MTVQILPASEAIARLGVGRLVCIDVSEYAIYQLEQELREAHPQMRGLYYTANVREADRLRAIVQANEPTVMFHAAAYKHVPLMEQLNEIEPALWAGGLQGKEGDDDKAALERLVVVDIETSYGDADEFARMNQYTGSLLVTYRAIE